MQNTSRSERVRPYFIERMQVIRVRALPDGGQWTYEAKLTATATLSLSTAVALCFGPGVRPDS